MVTVTPRQHALPIIGARTATPKRSAAPAPTDYRSFYVSGFDRRGRDFYATPTWVTEALLWHVRFRGPVWKPSCGDGAISTVLATHGYDVVSTDIAECGFGTPGVDFLACRSVRSECGSIITNPPYGEAAAHEGQPRFVEGATGRAERRWVSLSVTTTAGAISGGIRPSGDQRPGQTLG
jgi:hypothetical protein